MKVLSARDVLKALPHYTSEFQVIDPANDAEVYAVLDAVGFDSRRGISYEVALHRDMSNHVAIGFRLCGEYNMDPKFRKFHDLTDRLVIAYTQDPSLGRELDEIRGKRFSYNNKEELEGKAKKPVSDHKYYSEEELKEMGYTSGEEEEYDGSISDDFETVAQQMDVLKAILFSARGE